MQITLNNNNLTNYFSLGESVNRLLLSAPGIKKLGADRMLPYSFKDQNSKTLLVTIGDSWSWGSDLSTHNDFYDFDDKDWIITNGGIKNINQNRLEHSYGNLLSNCINSDWLNLSCPGAGNFHIADRVSELSKLIPKLDYDKIIVVCVFTEVCRHFNSADDTTIDHHMLFQNFTSIENFLSDLNKFAVDQIVSVLADFTHVQLLVGTNFVDKIGFDRLSGQQLLSTPWYQLLGIGRSSAIFLAGDLSWPNFVRSIEDNTIPAGLHQLFKQFIVDCQDYEKTIEREYEQSLYFDGKLHHPNKQGHKLWADYLFERIQNIGADCARNT